MVMNVLLEISTSMVCWQCNLDHTEIHGLNDDWL